MQKPMIIGISGATSSGKSLLANTIVKELGSKKVVVISEDSYYKEYKDLSYEELIKINYDHPNSLDHELLCTHLRQLLNGETVQIPNYDFAKYARKSETREINGQHAIIVLEGVLVFVLPELRDLMNIRIFMDTPLDICLLRRVQRDILERGRTIESVLEQYHATVRPMYLQFIEPSKRYADIIVPRGGANRIAIDMIKAKMKERLNSF
ncbi:MAG: uridine kinase [Gammaproteobacteria bacterium]|nr:uridine kinase [Gammaproteobacteria bacterium]